MRLNINTARMKMVPFHPEPEKEGKGWSYSSVYFLRDLKDIYLLYSQNGDINSITDLYNICIRDQIESENKKEWTLRNLLELVNALKNFGLLDKENCKPIKVNVFDSEINDPLSTKDMEVFKCIYKSYFRFEEFHRLFQDKGNMPTMIYAYMDGSRFFNRFIRPDQNIIYYIEEERKDVMRFWDVYTKWGTTLGVINKCSLKGMDIITEDEKLSNAYALNIIVDIPSSFSILQYMEEEIGEKYVYIPFLEWKIISQYGYSLDMIKSKLAEECELRSSEYRLQRTSAIFVDNNERNLFIEYNNTYMSHILKL